MGAGFHIDGTQEFGYSTINRYWYSFYIFMNTVKRVCARYNNASVWDLNGYAAHFCYRRLKSFDTLAKVVLEHKDYISAGCILRMLGDSVAVFHLIYMEPEPDLRWLRHALYVIDGCEENLKVLPDLETNKDVMTEVEFEQIQKGVRFNRSLRERLMNQAQQILDQSPLQTKNKEAFDKIVKDRNWKFKEFKTYKRVYNNRFEQRELYERIDMSEGYDVLSFISQYAHGLSMSNLVMDMNEHNRDGILCEALGLIKRLNAYLMHYYFLDYDYIMNGLLEPDMRDKILTCFDEEHRPSNEVWNQHIMNLMEERGFLC